MSHNQHKKRHFGDESDNHSDSNTSQSSCGCKTKGGCNQCRACIICPPCDYRETYETGSSEHSCPDFSDLCDDQSRHCEKKEKKQKKEKTATSCDYSDSEDSEDCETECSSGDKLNEGGQRACSNCYGGGCHVCTGRHCEDHSRTSVLEALSGSSSCDSCPDLKDLPCDQERECDKKCHDDSDKKESYGKAKKFVVSYGPKKGHPWAEYNQDCKSIHINGKNGPALHLYRGCTYFFCIESCGDDHCFVLTNKPDGGHGSKLIPGGFEPISKGCVCLKVDKCTPRYFFYQDAGHRFEGGLITVHD